MNVRSIIQIENGSTRGFWYCNTLSTAYLNDEVKVIIIWKYKVRINRGFTRLVEPTKMSHPQCWFSWFTVTPFYEQLIHFAIIHYVGVRHLFGKKCKTILNIILAYRSLAYEFIWSQMLILKAFVNSKTDFGTFMTIWNSYYLINRRLIKRNQLTLVISIIVIPYLFEFTRG